MAAGSDRVSRGGVVPGLYFAGKLIIEYLLLKQKWQKHKRRHLQKQSPKSVL